MKSSQPAIHPADARRTRCGDSSPRGCEPVSGLLVRCGLLALLSLPLASCGEEPEPEPQLASLEILEVTMASPMLEGSRFVLTVRGLTQDSGRLLELRSVADDKLALLSEAESPVPGSIAFALDAATVASLGVGAQELRLVVFEGEEESFAYPVSFTLAAELPIQLEAGIDGLYHRNEVVVLIGDGLVDPSEGSLTAEIVGSFVADDGGTTTVLAQLPVVLAEANQRRRGQLTLTTALGGLKPGVLDGTMTLQSELNNGAKSKSAEQGVHIEFLGPELYSYAPERPYLGQVVTIRGAGLLGGAESDEATIIVFEGELEDAEGGVTPFPAKEAVVEWVSGGEVRFGLDTEVKEAELVASFFGVARGHFRGTIAPVVILGTEDERGAAIPAEISFGGITQPVVVRFLPGFYESLRHFGLSSAAEQVVDIAMQRMRDIYADYAVHFVDELPGDYLLGAVSTVEIGGPDPNGLGMFGYDNTPGKDVGNLRLFDSIGGANAQTQADNFPGYGGVFIDSIMMWSAHPADILGENVSSQPDPLFDEIFDPVRDTPATLEEAQGLVGGERGAQVSRAIRALGSIIGETAAHEVGHSLGLSQPMGPRDAYHTAAPADGCLMDAGAYRPLTERAAEPGAPKPAFCFDEIEYLQRILPRED